MPDVTISYKGSPIASMDASGTKTLLTEGKYCEDDIFVSYNKTGNATAEGDSSVSVNDAESGNICSLIQYGVCEQDAQTNAISCNNGILSVSSGEIVTTAANREAITLGSQTATVENLYSVGNIRDEQELVTGTVTRKNAACIYDGTQPVGDRYISSTGAKDNGAIIIYPLETEHTGDSVVSFMETVKQDISSLEVRIEPVQDLHGYANPWPAGGGVNVWDEQWELGAINGSGASQKQADRIRSKNYIPVTPGATYYYNVNSTYGLFTWGYDSSKTYVCRVPANGWAIRNNTVTIPNGVYYIRIVVQPGYGTTYNNDISINYPASVTSYRPYSNICPISGRTGMSVYRRSANLLNSATNITGKYITASGGISNGDDAQYTDLIPVKEGETYVASFVSGRNSGTNRWHGYDVNGGWVKELKNVSATGQQGARLVMAATIDSGISYVRLSYGINDTEAMICLVDSDSQISADGYYLGHQASNAAAIDNRNAIQSPYTSASQYQGPAVVFSVLPGKIYVVKADAVTNYTAIRSACYNNIEDINNNSKAVSRGEGAAFVAPDGANYAVVAYINSASGTTFTFDEPYAGEISAYQPYIYNEYPCDWSSQAGTVYGGTVDVVTGLLTVDRGCVNVSSSWYWYKSGSYSGGFYATIENAGTGQKTNTPFLCSHAKTATSISQYVQGTCFCDGSINIRIMDGSDTVQDWKDYINAQSAAGTPIQICYELATPLTYQLTAQEVVTLVGVNNIFSPDATSIKVAVSNQVIEYVAPQPLTLAEGSNTVSATNLSVSSVPLELNYISKVVQPTPTLQSKTVSPATSVQTITPDSGYDGLSQVTVNAISPTKTAQTYTPTTTDQTIQSGRWLTGNQTIKGDANLVASNIKKDVQIFGVTGSYEGSGGGGSNPVAEKKDVNFIDYDGTLLYSYTASEFANLSALPNNPSHEGLIAQGWNWSLANAKTYVASYGKLWIGQMYITESGDTEIDVELHAPRLSPYLGIAVNGTVEVDWGDESTKSTVTGTSLTTQVRTSHVYATDGLYTIKIHVVSGSFSLYGTSTYSFFSGNFSVSNYNRVYASSVIRVRIGSSTSSIGTYAFYTCYSLASITIPSSVTNIGTNAFFTCYSLTSLTIPNNITSINNYAFASCHSLASITIPNSVTSISSNAFSSCYSLASIIIPSSVTSIGTYAFNSCSSLASITILSNVTSISNSMLGSCYSLASITIPSSVTSIGTSAFSNCYGLGLIRFERTTPPTVSNSNAWTSLSTDCVIHVPSGSLSAYTSATNYPSSSKYTYVED